MRLGLCVLRFARRLCRDLGIEYPILSAGIGSAAGPEFVSAVSNAGGFGVLGVSGMQPDEIRGVIARTRELTERPFGVNVIIDQEGWATTDDDRRLLHDEVTAAAEEGVAAVVLFSGAIPPRMSTRCTVAESSCSPGWIARGN